MNRRRRDSRRAAVNQRAKARTWTADTRPLWVRALSWLGVKF